MGCDAITGTSNPKTDRYQTLISLMLSSQTKDAVNFEALANLRLMKPDGLTIESVLSADREDLHDCIRKVGYHNKKVDYILKTTAILKQDFDGDIPDTLEGLLSLPGVGPKMAYIILQVAWKLNIGIGVDTHVHRISNRLGWVHTKTPEQTRIALESWLPSSHWRSINPLLVGYGQTLCKPIGPMCGVCPVSDLCGKVGVDQSPKRRIKKEVKVEDALIKMEIEMPVEIKKDVKVEASVKIEPVIETESKVDTSSVLFESPTRKINASLNAFAIVSPTRPPARIEEESPTKKPRIARTKPSTSK